jgi:hypothetical protein
MVRVFGRLTWVRVILGVAVLGPLVPSAFAALPSYPLYYSFDIPHVMPGYVLGSDGTQTTTYTGTLRGTLGGISLRSASFAYGNGSSQAAGGGTFTLATDVGEVRDGHILMTTDGKRTTLLFFGVYLGTRLEFSLTSDSPQIGGTGVVATGLARTGFASHDEYMAAVQKGAAALPPASRDQTVAQADTNPRLVSGYQQKLPH